MEFALINRREVGHYNGVGLVVTSNLSAMQDNFRTWAVSFNRVQCKNTEWTWKSSLPADAGRSLNITNCPPRNRPLPEELLLRLFWLQCWWTCSSDPVLLLLLSVCDRIRLTDHYSIPSLLTSSPITILQPTRSFSNWLNFGSECFLFRLWLNCAGLIQMNFQTFTLYRVTLISDHTKNC